MEHHGGGEQPDVRHHVVAAAGGVAPEAAGARAAEMVWPAPALPQQQLAILHLWLPAKTGEQDRKKPAPELHMADQHDGAGAGVLHILVLLKIEHTRLIVLSSSSDAFGTGQSYCFRLI